MLKRYKNIEIVKYCQKRKMWSNNVFFAHIYIVFAPNWTEIRLEIFCSNVSTIFPNRTRIGSEKFSTNPYQKCRTELESVRKKFAIFLGFFSEPNWNRFGNGHWIKCSSSAVLILFVTLISPTVISFKTVFPNSNIVSFGINFFLNDYDDEDQKNYERYSCLYDN